MWSKYFCYRTTSSISTCKSNNQRRKFSYDIIWRWSKEITNLPFVRVQFLEESMRGIVRRSKGSKDCLWIIQELSCYNLQRGAMTRHYSLQVLLTPKKTHSHEKEQIVWKLACVLFLWTNFRARSQIVVDSCILSRARPNVVDAIAICNIPKLVW